MVECISKVSNEALEFLFVQNDGNDQEVIQRQENWERSGFKCLFFSHDKFSKVFCCKPDFLKKKKKKELGSKLKSRHIPCYFTFIALVA